MPIPTTSFHNESNDKIVHLKTKIVNPQSGGEWL